jgi:hypothetical protein
MWAFIHSQKIIGCEFGNKPHVRVPKEFRRFNEFFAQTDIYLRGIHY